MKRIIIGISGASGSVYGKCMLEMLRPMDDVETHLIVSSAGQMNIAHELGMDRKAMSALADVTYKDNEIWEKIASGSFKTIGMAIMPCSVKTLSTIATGYSATLMARAADVCLKERRRLSLLVRETPLHLGHIRNMASVTEMGGIIELPVPAFYHKPNTISDLIDETCAKVLDGFGLDMGKYLQEWKGL